MIKACLKCDDGRPMLLLGISRGNLDRLMQGKPMLIDK